MKHIITLFSIKRLTISDDYLSLYGHKKNTPLATGQQKKN